jgi:hypothetical protein
MKHYIKPETEITNIELVNVIAASLPKTDDPITNPLSKGEYIMEDVDIFGTKKDKWAVEEEEEE